MKKIRNIKHLRKIHALFILLRNFGNKKCVASAGTRRCHGNSFGGVSEKKEQL